MGRYNGRMIGKYPAARNMYMGQRRMYEESTRNSRSFDTTIADKSDVNIDNQKDISAAKSVTNDSASILGNLLAHTIRTYLKLKHIQS